MIENWLKSIRSSPNLKKGARGRPSKTLNEEEGTLRKKCPYSALFWSVFSRFQTEYGEIRSTSPYSVRMRENAGHNNSEYGHFSRSEID